MSVWTLGYSESQKISMELLSAPADVVEEGYDWINAACEISVGGFRGGVQLMITLKDLKRFRDELTILYQTLKGEAEFKTIENQIYFKLTADLQGHIQVEGSLMDDAGVGNKLQFYFGIDQTFLKSTLHELNNCIDEC